MKNADAEDSLAKTVYVEAVTRHVPSNSYRSERAITFVIYRATPIAFFERFGACACPNKCPANAARMRRNSFSGLIIGEVQTLLMQVQCPA